MADAATGQPRQVTTKPVLATLVRELRLHEGRQADRRRARPGRPGRDARRARSRRPGPTVKLAEDSDKNRLRTFPSLMSTPYEFQLLEWHATGQVAMIDVIAPTAPPAKGKAPKLVPAPVKKIGPPAMIRALDLSPDGKYVRVTRMVKPFSYIVPVSSSVGRRGVGPRRQGAGELDERPLNLGVADDTQPRRIRRRAPAARRRSQQGSASSRGARTARA